MGEPSGVGGVWPWGGGEPGLRSVLGGGGEPPGVGGVWLGLRWGPVQNKCSDVVWFWGAAEQILERFTLKDCSSRFFERAIPIHANICQSGQGCEIRC